MSGLFHVVKQEACYKHLLQPPEAIVFLVRSLTRALFPRKVLQGTPPTPLLQATRSGGSRATGTHGLRSRRRGCEGEGKDPRASRRAAQAAEPIPSLLPRLAQVLW